MVEWTEKPKFEFAYKKGKVSYYRTIKAGKAIWKGLELEFELGWVTDFASVPWWAMWLVKQDGPYRYATVLHDKALEDGWKRSIARDIFWDELKTAESQTGKFKTAIIFVAVWLHDFDLKYRKTP